MESTWHHSVSSAKAHETLLVFMEENSAINPMINMSLFKSDHMFDLILPHFLKDLWTDLRFERKTPIWLYTRGVDSVENQVFSASQASQSHHTKTQYLSYLFPFEEGFVSFLVLSILL